MMLSPSHVRFRALPPRTRLRIGLLAGWLLLVPAGYAGELNPPKPNPSDPVNYIAWINETFGGDIEDNARDIYLEAYELLEPFNGEWGDTLRQPWSEHKEVSEWLAANLNGLGKFRQAARQRDCFFRLGDPKCPDDPRMNHHLVGAMLPALGAHRNAVKGMIALGYREWENGNHDRLLTNSLLVLRSAHHFDNSPTLIGRLVGISCARMAYAALRNAFALSDDPDSLATEILPRLHDADPVPPPFGRTCEVERLIAWDTCQRLFVRRKWWSGAWKLHQPLCQGLVEVGGVLRELGDPGLRESDLKKVAKVGYDAVLREIDAYFDAVDHWNATPYHLAGGRADQFERLIADSKNPLLRQILPSLTRARTLDERITAERRATHLIAHLFVHHSKTGTFPKTLDGLDAPGLAELRIDPFSGRDFVYRKTDRGFTLYTLADNLRDDQGRHDPKWEDGDFVFWPVEE